MVVDAIACVTGWNRCIVTILREHVKLLGSCDALVKAFSDRGLSIDVCVLDVSTRSQSQTIARTIEAFGVSGPVFAKDCDNVFCVDVTPERDDENFVCVADLTDYDSVNAKNKSYCVVDDDGFISVVKEKQIVSTKFSVGGYFFSSAQGFVSVADYLDKEFLKDEIYVSHVINRMIGCGHVFRSRKVNGYVDWGTHEDWRKWSRRFATYFIDIDGVILTSSHRRFFSGRSMSAPIVENVAVCNALFDAGNVIVLATARQENEREQTVKQLTAAGVKYHHLVMGCLHGRRVIVNDHAATNDYPSAEAVSIPRGSSDLASYLGVRTQSV